MSVPGIHEIQALALKYSKPQLANMAQSGLIDTQKAVLAAMMRDRISKEDAKPPTTTVAQDVMGMQPPQMAQPAPQMAQAALQARPQMGAPAAPAPVAPEQMAATGGLTSIPIKSEDYAGGGIVAFAKGGDTPYTIYDYKPEEQVAGPVLTWEDQKRRQQEMQQAFGIDPEFYKKREEEVGLEREKLGKEKSGSLADALIAGGLGVAAGTSPYALQNIATGATKGFETYQGQMKDIRERDKALIESQNKIKEAAYLRSIGQGEAADKAIQESIKDERAVKNANINIRNKASEEIAKAKTEASKTQFTEKEATHRTNISAANAMAIAKLPPAELRMVQELNDEAVKKATAKGEPVPSLMDTYETMKLAQTKALVGMDPAAMFQKYSVDWNKMPMSEKLEYQSMNPPITSAAEYAKFMVNLTPQRSGANPPAVGGSRTPPPPEGFVTNPLN